MRDKIITQPLTSAKVVEVQIPTTSDYIML